MDGMTKNFLLIKQANQVSNLKDQSESFGIGIKNLLRSVIHVNYKTRRNHIV